MMPAGMPAGPCETHPGLPLQPLLALCDRLALPLCLFDDHAAIIWCNASARALAASRRRRRGNDSGVALFADLQRRLKHQIGSVRSWPGDRIEAAVERFGDTSIDLVRVIDGDSAFVIGLFTRKVANDRTIRQKQLVKFGLTATECWIAEQMLGGHTTVEITHASTITLSTVRTHIKHIYSKLGVHCREKMRAKLETG